MPVTAVGATAYQISASPSWLLENAARCHASAPPVTPVKRCPPDVGPSVPSSATIRVLGWVENDVDEIDVEGEFCCVTEVDVVIAARLPAPPSSRPTIAQPHGGGAPLP